MKIGMADKPMAIIAASPAAAPRDGEDEEGDRQHVVLRVEIAASIQPPK